MKRPKIAITLGDPAGVGPELCWKVLADAAVRAVCEPIIVGEPEILLDVADALYGPETRENHARFLAENAACVHRMGKIRPEDFTPGEVSATCGAAAYAYVREAIRMCQAGEVAAMVTAPLHKEALHLAGVPFPGHTEILVAETHAPRHVMMLTAEEITAALVTAHVGYVDVPKKLTAERVQETILLTADAMRRIRGREQVRLTVCGLNPHAGEHGLFGRGEEERIIVPAIQETLKTERESGRTGLTIIGPLPPDTAFLPRRRAETDAYVCMTHDQGLIPLKMLAFDSAVNITLGLSIIRTSVDHGTAMDIVRTGKAAISSMREAIFLAVKLAKNEF